MYINDPSQFCFLSMIKKKGNLVKRKEITSSSSRRSFHFKHRVWEILPLVIHLKSKWRKKLTTNKVNELIHAETCLIHYVCPALSSSPFINNIIIILVLFWRLNSQNPSNKSLLQIQKVCYLVLYIKVIHGWNYS